MIAPRQQRLAAAQLAIAQAFGVGGAAWTVTTITGGEDAPPVETAVSTITLYVRKIQDTVATSTGPQYIGQTRYKGYGPLSDLAAGDTIASTTDAAYRFQVLTVETDRGIVEATLERL